MKDEPLRQPMRGRTRPVDVRLERGGRAAFPTACGDLEVRERVRHRPVEPRQNHQGAASLQGEIIALAVFAILIMGAAVSRFRKRLD